MHFPQKISSTTIFLALVFSLAPKIGLATCKITAPPAGELSKLTGVASAGDLTALWRHLRETRTDQRRIALVKDAMAMTEGFPASELTALTQAFDDLILGELNGDELTAAAIAAIDACERIHAERVRAATAGLVGHEPGAKTTVTPLKINDLLASTDKIVIVPEQDYRITFEREDPALKGEHTVRFSKDVAQFLNDPSQKYPGRRWLEVICKGIAPPKGVSGLKRPITSDRVGQIYNYLVKFLVSAQNHMLGVVKLTDGTLYVRDLFDHDSG